MVWTLAQHLFDFSLSVVHLTLFALFFVMKKKVSHSNMHSESKNQNTKRRMEIKNISYFIFELRNPRMLILPFFKLYCPFLWMGFNCIKARATLRRQFTFYHEVPRNFWYSFYWPQKDERLSWPWTHPVVLKMGPMDWESSIFTLIWVVRRGLILPSPPCWFSLNKSKTVKAVTLAFCSIQ